MEAMIYKQLIACLRGTSAITKDKKNAQQGYRFRGIDDVYNALHPIFEENGVLPVPEVLESRREERQTKGGGNLIYTVLKLKVTFYAEDGSNVSAIVQGEGMDSADKSTNKAMSAAYKYALFQLLCIPTEETAADADAETPEISRPVQKEPICERCGMPVKGVQFETGKRDTAEEIADRTKSSYGKTLCWHCSKAERAMHEARSYTEGAPQP